MKMRLCFLILFASLSARANWSCSENFSDLALLFYKHLFHLSIEDESQYFTSVKNLGVQQDGRLAFRLKKPLFGKPNWSSMRAARIGTPTPQGDVRSFIFIAGPRLASKFGFEFREDKRGVALLVPTALHLEKTIRKLNVHLLQNGKEPISYLPKRAGFLRKGESLDLAINHTYEDGISVQFPYADLDHALAPHEASFHLGPILFPQVFNVKSNAINREVDRMAHILRSSDLPRSKNFADWLIASREFENDFGYGNLQDLIANLRRDNGLMSFSEIATKVKSAYPMTRKRASHYVSLLAAPHYTPQEYVIRKLIRELGVQNFFISQEKLIESAHDFHENGLHDRPFFLLGPTVPTVERYNIFIRNQINQLEPPPAIPGRQSGEPLFIEMLQGLDQRIRDLIDAFDAIGN